MTNATKGTEADYPTGQVLAAIMSPEEAKQHRHDVEFGLCSTVTIIHKQDGIIQLREDGND